MRSSLQSTSELQSAVREDLKLLPIEKLRKPLSMAMRRKNDSLFSRLSSPYLFQVLEAGTTTRIKVLEAGTKRKKRNFRASHPKVRHLWDIELPRSRPQLHGSMAIGPMHFTVISTEHDWSSTSEQYAWMKSDLESVGRFSTPWIVFTGCGSEICSSCGTIALEKQGRCLQHPIKDLAGVDFFDTTIYSAPVHTVVGMAEFTLDDFPHNFSSWSLIRRSVFGYARVTADKTKLLFEYITTDGQ
ncbi:hypothetical protein SELMODRAFT_429179 [Selaginella moellendorffii]|uniref:Purple acid phosphatase C-terminal domain-containing protein n=1 Tax=Selaginella moellendorffii TaxID=88036 RepID=D8T5A7_SELML|nr:hypothetical protein SELMODRAFT_429179 [Selaginella moellendorffii]